jgi:hypothetical protein
VGDVVAAALIFDYSYLFIYLFIYLFTVLSNDAESSLYQTALITQQVKDNILKISTVQHCHMVRRI